ncbi:MAG: ABC transporter permease, partial [Dehalococcoidia bacterium]
LIAALFFTPAYHLLDSPLVIFVLPMAFLSGLLFGSIAMCFTSVAPSMSAYNFLWALVINPMWWFGGAFYPLSTLPPGLRVLAEFIPLTHVVRINRGLVEGDLGWEHLASLAVVLAVTAFFFAFALWTMRRRLIK